MKSTKVDKVLIAYVPVPHAGYLKLFRTFSDSTLYVLGEEFIREFKPLTRHLPGVTPTEAMEMIQSLGIFREVRILTPMMLVAMRHARIVMPDEDVSHALAKKYLPDAQVEFAADWRLRWDWGATQMNRRPEGEEIISIDTLDRKLMRDAFLKAARSPDWWRQIGALLVKDGKVLISAFNRHVPSEQSAYCYGDPRSNFDPGVRIDASLALHAEIGVITEAAHRGLSMEGGDLYVTTFPCPPCAHACAFSGIKRLFYVDGYAVIAGAEVLQAKGVEIIRVEM
ncbi:MAG: deaminase [Candidatus Kaiserbacteria bacterium]|nr:deaminase [Candidatus Kaiserbacteria bacterium]